MLSMTKAGRSRGGDVMRPLLGSRIFYFPSTVLDGTVLSPIRICVRSPRGSQSARLDNFFFDPLQCDKMTNSVSGALQRTLDMAPSICLLLFSTVA